ncbi:MAG: DUF692 domain-containing protein [Gammaproteobacteria bacterium]|jgi:uncharacterized protein (UPF0276 family)
MRRLGVGYRQPLAHWINTHPAQLNCLEITAEHFFDDASKLAALGSYYDLFVHGLGLSLGTPGPLDKSYLDRFKTVCEIAQPLWISEHIAFTRAADIDLGHLNPIPYTPDTLAYFVEHALELKAHCQRPLLLENVTSHIAIPSPLSETAFINALCQQAGCGLLLDVTNLLVNSRNHGYSPTQWLREIHPDFIKQLHIVGYSQSNGTFFDSHANNIQQDLYQLTRQVIDYSQVDSIIIERDHNFPSTLQLEQELANLERCFDIH